MKIASLLKDLFSYTIINTSTISAEAKSVLANMQQEFQRLDKSSEPNKQEKMIALFMGGTILALKQDDWKYHYDASLYPREASEKVLKNNDAHMSIIEAMYATGREALKDLPHLFNSNIFKLKVKLINSNDKINFFPELNAHADKVDNLIKFCIKYADDLERSEVDNSLLEGIAVDSSFPLQVEAKEDTINKTQSNPSFSNLSMQVLGGFMAALGVAAVACAFVVLNAATMGMTGLIIAGAGFASSLAGVGLFSYASLRNNASKSNEMVEAYTAQAI